MCGFPFLARQFNRKAAAFAHLAPDAHLSAVSFNDMFHDAQADAHPLGLAAQFVSTPVKPFENLFLLPLRYAFTLVFNPEQQAARAWSLAWGRRNRANRAGGRIGLLE